MYVEEINASILPGKQQPSNNNLPVLLDSKSSHKSSTKSSTTSSFSKQQVKLEPAQFIVERTGQRIRDHYDIEKHPLGVGGYGSVCKANHKMTKSLRAIKAMSKSQMKNLETFKQEISIMKKLDHPNIIKLHETFEDRRNIYLVMELCAGGELFDKILEDGCFGEVEAAILMQQILRALYYLHERNIVHRDLKPENFLFASKAAIEKNNLKMIDFGLSTELKSGEHLKSKAGTPYYVAPQVLTGKYCQAVDLWSCGVIMYVLLCGYPPFYGKTDADVLAKVKAGTYSFRQSDFKDVTEDAKNLIRSLLKMDPQQRLTAKQSLEHTWIKDKAPRAIPGVSLQADFVQHLRGFQSASHLKKAALQVIAGQLSDQHIKALRDTFVALDANGDGRLTVAEMKAGLKKGGLKELPVDLSSIMEDVDANGDGVIDYTEFLAATLQKKQYMQEDVCWRAFATFDLNGDGKISSDELQKVLHDDSVSDALGTDTIDKLMLSVDENGDGHIDFAEFMAMMRNDGCSP